MLPPDERVHGEAPRRVLPAPSVPAVVGRVAHLREDRTQEAAGLDDGILLPIYFFYNFRCHTVKIVLNQGLVYILMGYTPKQA